MNAFENNLACSLLSARSHVLKYSQAAECSRVFLLDFQGLSPDILCFQRHHCTELIQRNDLQTEKYSSLMCCIVLMLFLLPSHCQFHQPQESRKLIRHKEQTLAVVCIFKLPQTPMCLRGWKQLVESKSCPRGVMQRKTLDGFPSSCCLSNSHRQISGLIVKTHFPASYNYDKYNRMLIYLTRQF